jgi:hypothetical protein
MIDVRQAAATATNYLISLYPQQSQSGVRLEEVELSEDERYWFITLSYPLPTYTANPIGTILNMPPQSKRDYKIFQIDTADGKVRSMKIRKLD